MTPSNRSSPRDLTQMSRELILSAALQIIDLHGVDGLSMRRLGFALCHPMSLSLFAANKTAPLDGVAELDLVQLVLDCTGR